MTFPRLTGRRLTAIAMCVVALAASSCCRHYTCCVPYGYAPPPPLPYLMYKACPTPIAKKFRWQPHAWTGPPADDDFDVDAAIEGMPPVPADEMLPTPSLP